MLSYPGKSELTFLQEKHSSMSNKSQVRTQSLLWARQTPIGKVSPNWMSNSNQQSIITTTYYFRNKYPWKLIYWQRSMLSQKGRLLFLIVEEGMILFRKSLFKILTIYRLIKLSWWGLILLSILMILLMRLESNWYRNSLIWKFYLNRVVKGRH